MTIEQLFQEFVAGMKATTPLEYIGVIAGIASVFLSRAENIWLYPVGLVNTVIYIYLSFKGDLPGEASVNIWYTILSLYGWIMWSRKKAPEKPLLQITFSTGKEWLLYLAVTAGMYAILYFLITRAQSSFAPGAIPWADAFAGATAYVGMWLMARKKVESWWWWIATDVASIPLYFAKEYVFTAVQFFVFLVLAVAGLVAWYRKAKDRQRNPVSVMA